jgi:hypothetical protein
MEGVPEKALGVSVNFRSAGRKYSYIQFEDEMTSNKE